MTRIRRGGQRVRAGGGRTRKEDCCCQPTCSEIQDPSFRSGWEASVQFNSLSIGSALCAGTCSNIPLSSVLPYATTLLTSWDWSTNGLIGCSQCTDGFTRTSPCQYWIIGYLRCVTGTVTLQAELSFQKEGGWHRPLTGVNYEWDVIYADSMPIADFALGTPFVLPLSSYSGVFGACPPPTATGSTCTIMFS